MKSEFLAQKKRLSLKRRPTTTKVGRAEQGNSVDGKVGFGVGMNGLSCVY